MALHPLKIFEKIDPELLKLVQDTKSFAVADGALPKKFKLLIAMALDAAHGSADGVRSLADQAMKAGATQAEILSRRPNSAFPAYRQAGAFGMLQNN